MPRLIPVLFALVLGAGPLLMGRVGAQEVPTPTPTPEQTIQALASCGVAAEHVRITYHDELQSDVVSFGDLGGADEARFRCLWNATFPAYLVDVSAAPQREAYQAFERRVGARLAEAEAREWLAKAGLLDRVPRYDPRKGLKTFARALETACSIRPGSALEASDSSVLTIRRSFFGDFMAPRIHDELTCLLRMESASNAEEHDIILAFVGNAAADEGDR